MQLFPFFITFAKDYSYTNGYWIINVLTDKSKQQRMLFALFFISLLRIAVNALPKSLNVYKCFMFSSYRHDTMGGFFLNYLHNSNFCHTFAKNKNI